MGVRREVVHGPTPKARPWKSGRVGTERKRRSETAAEVFVQGEIELRHGERGTSRYGEWHREFFVGRNPVGCNIGKGGIVKVRRVGIQVAGDDVAPRCACKNERENEGSDRRF